MGVAVGTEKAICKNLSSMAHNLFKKDITWFKVNFEREQKCNNKSWKIKKLSNVKIYYCVSGGELLQPRFRSCCWLCQTGEAEDYIAEQVGCVYVRICAYCVFVRIVVLHMRIRAYCVCVQVTAVHFLKTKTAGMHTCVPLLSKIRHNNSQL